MPSLNLSLSRILARWQNGPRYHNGDFNHIVPENPEKWQAAPSQASCWVIGAESCLYHIVGRFID